MKPLCSSIYNLHQSHSSTSSGSLSLKTSEKEAIPIKPAAHHVTSVYGPCATALVGTSIKARGGNEATMNIYIAKGVTNSHDKRLKAL